MARPTDYNTEIADRIIHEIRTTSKGLSKICEPEEMPCRATVYNWMDENKEFLDRYARAKEDQADMLVEEILTIADDSSNDTIMGEYGPMEDKEWVNRSKLRVEARKWAASKLKPKKYGDKLDVTSGDLPLHSIGVHIVPPKPDDE